MEGSAFRNFSIVGLSLAIVIVAEPTMTNAISSHGVHQSGIQCRPYGENSPQGPRNYSVAEIGRRGVPMLTSSQLKMLSSIRKFVKSTTLRFSFISGDFIVFDAIDGACFDGGAPGYPVLNGACNEYYQPGEDPRKTVPAPGCIGPPRPWISSDKGLPGDPRVWSQSRPGPTSKP
jgi:hypothetical protein